MIMKPTGVLSCLAGLRVIFILFSGNEALPTTTTTLASDTTTNVFLNFTNSSYGNLEVEINSSNETESPVATERTGRAALKELGAEAKATSGSVTTNETPTNVTAKFSTEGEASIQKLDEDSTPVKKAISKDQPHTESTKTSKVETARLKSTPPPIAEEDKKIRQSWGGNCTLAIWNHCSTIRSWGGDYLVPDKNHPGKMIVRNYKVDCVEKPEKTFCLRNGWTVARCHMLCMSQCNIEYRQNYDKLVDHEGECRMPILGRK